MIVGVGIDLIERERVARALDRWGERLVAKLSHAEVEGAWRRAVLGRGVRALLT